MSEFDQLFNSLEANDPQMCLIKKLKAENAELITECRNHARNTNKLMDENKKLKAENERLKVVNNKLKEVLTDIIEEKESVGDDNCDHLFDLIDDAWRQVDGLGDKK